MGVEVAELDVLVTKADAVRISGTDTKWLQLRGLLRVRNTQNSGLALFCTRCTILQ